MLIHATGMSLHMQRVSDLNFRSTSKAIHSAYYLIINIEWYFQHFGNNNILTIFWKWFDNCITIYCQTIFWGMVSIFPIVSIFSEFHNFPNENNLIEFKMFNNNKKVWTPFALFSKKMKNCTALKHLSWVQQTGKPGDKFTRKNITHTTIHLSPAGWRPAWAKSDKSLLS